ncbi:hypothetical protein LSTR_LSTR001961 [Laodelphax striatellus]|uniref:Uncharacterized protein n=1 Tax=Laodelphax striatellus TaxID=195883 RepID=A0A482XHJ5_LAOST|nr:hypothetical protein LSTR_LSTR001961 [Laodelphax striatellus]
MNFSYLIFAVLSFCMIALSNFVSAEPIGISSKPKVLCKSPPCDMMSPDYAMEGRLRSKRWNTGKV